MCLCVSERVCVCIESWTQTFYYSGFLGVIFYFNIWAVLLILLIALTISRLASSGATGTCLHHPLLEIKHVSHITRMLRRQTKVVLFAPMCPDAANLVIMAQHTLQMTMLYQHVKGWIWISMVFASIETAVKYCSSVFFIPLKVCDLCFNSFFWFCNKCQDRSNKKGSGFTWLTIPG